MEGVVTTVRALSGVKARSDRESAYEALLYLITALGAGVITYVVLDLNRADLRVLMRPWFNGFDAWSVAAGVKGFIEHHSFAVNPSIGAPGGLQAFDFPGADALHQTGIALIALLTRDSALTVNLYYLLSFPLSALAALFVLRKFSVSRPAAVLASLLFAFIPFHYISGTAHLYLAAYYMVPFAVMLALQLDSKRPPFLASDSSATEGYRFRLFDRPSLGFAALAVLIGASGIYYAFFTCWFLAIGGVLAAVGRKSWKRLASAGIVAGIVVFTVAVQLMPSWWYRLHNGVNPAAVQRSATMADTFALRLSQLVLPIPLHRFADAMGVVSAYWNRLYRIIGGMNETAQVALGAIGAAGFLMLLAWLLFVRVRPGARPTRFSALMDQLSVLNAGGLLLGTVGGMGSILAIDLPQVRAYDRVSVFIAFMAFFAVALLIDRATAAVPERGASASVALALCACLLVFGIIDQVAPSYLPAYQTLAYHDRSDKAVVRQIEAAVPPGSMVFQLPYIPFPEMGDRVGKMLDYEQFRGYLQSRQLRWSYGAMKGRADDAWIRRTALLSAPQMVSALKTAGFRAIWVDRKGYADEGTSMQTALAAATKSQPIVSADGEFAVFLLK